MNPIFTTSNKKGLNGYWYDEFVNQFDAICQEHLATGRANKFAFIIYDFHSATHQVLQNHGVFTELDRLSGTDITVFYIDGQINEEKNTQNKLYKNLNNVLVELTNQPIQSIPFIVFFDFVDGDVTNFKCYTIRNDEKFILNDLTKAIASELKPLTIDNSKNKKSSISSIIKETPKIIYTEFIKLTLKGIWEAK